MLKTRIEDGGWRGEGFPADSGTTADRGLEFKMKNSKLKGAGVRPLGQGSMFRVQSSEMVGFLTGFARFSFLENFQIGNGKLTRRRGGRGGAGARSSIQSSEVKVQSHRMGFQTRSQGWSRPVKASQGQSNPVKPSQT